MSPVSKSCYMIQGIFEWCVCGSRIVYGSKKVESVLIAGADVMAEKNVQVVLPVEEDVFVLL